jgi:hypothetical protein
MSTKRKITVFLALAAVGLASGLAGAVTDNAPGSMCVGSGTGKLTVKSNGETENQSTAAVTALCPSERAAAPATTQFSGTVWVRDRNASAEICCRLMTKNPGGAVVTGEWSCSAGSSSSYQSLSLVGISDTYTWSHVYVECSVPPQAAGLNSAILTYRVNQS